MKIKGMPYLAGEGLLNGQPLDRENLFRLGMAFNGLACNLPDGIVDFDPEAKMATAARLLSPENTLWKSIIDVTTTACSMGKIFYALLNRSDGAEQFGYGEASWKYERGENFSKPMMPDPKQLTVFEAENPLTDGNFFCCDINILNMPFAHNPGTGHTVYKPEARTLVFTLKKILYTVKGATT